MTNSIKNIQEKYFSESKTYLWFLFFLTILLTLFPFFKIGFTTADDFGYYLRTLDGTVFSDAVKSAENTGRFYLYFVKPIYSIPYLVDNFYFTKIIQYSFLLWSFILFTVLIKRIFKQNEFSLLIFLLLFTFLSVTPNFHIPVIAYPFYFTFSFSIFLISLLQLLKYYETNKYKCLIVSATLFSVALLFYENFLIFLLFILGFMALKNFVEQKFRFLKNKSFYKEILPFILVFLAYLTCYFIYKKINNERGYYSGSSFVQDFNIHHFLEVLINYNKASLPTKMYHEFRSIIEMYSLLQGGHRHNFWYILQNSTLITILNSIIQSFLFVSIVLKIKSTISWKKAGMAFLILLLLTFSVHILLGLTDKYQGSDYWRNVSGYVTTYYSYFCITTLIGFVIYACIKAFYSNKYLKNLTIGVFSVVIFGLSIMMGYTNEHLSRAWQQSQNKFNIMDKVLEKRIFDKIPKNATIYTGELNPSLYDFGLGICSYPSSWKDYVFLKTGKKLNIYTLLDDFKHNLLQDSLQHVYYISLYDTPKNQDVLLVLSKINNNSIKKNEEETMLSAITANEADVYYYSPNKEFIFEFYIPKCKQDSSFVFINNVNYKVYQGLNAIRINNMNKKEEITLFTIKSSEPFLAKSFSISTIGDLDTECFQFN